MYRNHEKSGRNNSKSYTYLLKQFGWILKKFKKPIFVFLLSFLLSLSQFFSFFPKLQLVNLVYASTPSTWWNTNYLYRSQITITASGSDIAASTDIKVTLDTALIQAAGRLRSDRKDWRIVYYNPSNSTWSEIARDYQETTTTYFQTQAGITDGSSDSNYYAYYGYSEETTSAQTYSGLSTNAIQFDGTSSQYVEAPDNSAWDITSNLTLEAWVYVGEIKSSYIIGRWSSPYAYVLALGQSYCPSNAFVLSVYNGASRGDACGTTVPTLNTWYHVAGTYNGAQVKLYINGSLEKTTDFTGSIATGTDGIGIGTRYGHDTAFFHGIIDEVRIWNVTRDITQISSGKDAELVGNESGLIGYWKFNENSGNATDSSPTGADGTVTGASRVIVTQWSGTAPTSITTASVSSSDSIRNGPTAVYYNGNHGGTYQIGQATSTDQGMTWTKNPGNPTLATGGGSGVKDQNVVYYNGTYYLFYKSYVTHSPFHLATSSNGVSWTNYGSNPILSPGGAGSWDADHLEMPTLYVDSNEADSDKRFKMLYIGVDADGIYRIGYAYSPDGYTWTKYSGNPVLSPGSSGSWDDSGVGNGTSSLLKIGSTWYLYYAAKKGSDDPRKYRIGLATATSLEGPWTKHASNPLMDGRSDAVQTTTAILGSGSTTATVGDTSVFVVNEPVFIYIGSTFEENRIASIDSATQLTLSTGVSREYASGTTIRSYFSRSLWPSGTIYDGSSWKMWMTLWDEIVCCIQGETTGYATSSDGINWTFDYLHSPSIHLGAYPTAWDDNSAENMNITFYTVHTPVEFGGSADSANTITWSWGDTFNDAETGFKIYNQEDTLKGTVGQNVISYQETGLDPNTLYIRYAKSYDSLSSSSPSNEALGYTLANIPSAPTVGFSSPAGTTLKVTIGVNSNPSSTEFAIYETSTGNYVQANGTLGASAVWQTYTNWGGGSGRIVSGLTEGTTYTFKVKARNGDSVETDLSTGSTGTPDGTAPTGGSIIYTNDYYTTASVSLTANDGTDTNSEINTSTRIVQRKSATLLAGSCGSYDSFAAITPSGTYPDFTDSTVSSSNCYQYQYLVSDNAGNEATYTSINEAKIDTEAPSIPGTPSTTSPTSDTTPSWTWTASSDSVSGLATNAYLLQWSEDSGFVSGVSSSTSTTNSFTHTLSLADGTWYSRVRAGDLAGNNSNYSSNGSVIVDTSTPTPTPTSTPTSDSGSSSSSSASAPNCNDQAPGAKAPWLYGAIAQDSGSVLLYFTEADNPVSKYVLEYGTKSGNYIYGVEDMGVNSRGQMTFLVKSLSPNTTYYFRVRGGNGCATGGWSNEISAKTSSFVSKNQLEIVSSKLESTPNEEEQTETTETITTSPQPTPIPLPSGYDVNVKVIDTNDNPIEGAKVTIHSDIRESVTNKDGLAEFKNVEPGEHKILITYNNLEGEQTVYLTGNVKEFDLNVTVQQKAILLSPLAYGIIGIMGLVMIGLIVLLIKAKKKE